jgi:hypothetical protein
MVSRLRPDRAAQAVVKPIEKRAGALQQAEVIRDEPGRRSCGSFHENRSPIIEQIRGGIHHAKVLNLQRCPRFHRPDVEVHHSEGSNLHRSIELDFL